MSPPVRSVAALLSLTLACREHSPAPVGVEQRGLAAVVARNQPAAAVPVVPSPGPWRHASAEELERLVVWASHLLIRHSSVQDPENVAFKMADFRSSLPLPGRSRDEALALARELARQARERPERFAELVREHSEDIVRRERGGSLGGVPATQLTPWPEVLDAITALAPGEVSDVVETWYGFHIFRRHAAPEPDTVTGRRIVIGHDRARLLHILRDGQPSRSREEALALAHRLYEQARRNPGEFTQLIDRHSEHPDRVVGGDFGTWSNRELTPFPSEVEVLDQLDVGAVAPPIDSVFGFEILQRVPNPERMSYAIDGIQLYFDPAAPAGDASSRASVQAQAQRLNEQLRQDPLQLESLWRQHLPYRARWLDGRGLPELTVALRSVAVGDVLTAPTQSARFFVVGRRVAAEAELAATIGGCYPKRASGGARARTLRCDGSRREP